MELPKRRRTRLPGYDYSQSGAYFVTICTQEKEKLLGEIVGRGLAPAGNELSPYGRIAEEQLLRIEDRYPAVSVEKHVIMPNHIHNFHAAE